ncbi:PP2C family protein-serine/threonine phosphatase [Streptomyces sp. NPDC018019]|uniref:PP2C family protein-serine/threonine phosphatase n=1 Tax=Streptomyces sp. NPDC018019 TaxID=3365030 RepID=UPI0037B6A410
MRAVRPAAWLWCIALVGTAVVTADAALGRDTCLIGLLMACPLLACTRLGGAATAGVSAGTLIAAVALAAAEDTLHFPDTAVRLLGLAAASVYAVWAARRHVRHEAQLEQVAVVAQRAILRPTCFMAEGVSVCARYRSAAPPAVIGGDLYAFVHVPGGLRLVIGDVRGKGLEAVRLAAAAIGHFRDAACTRPGLAEVVAEMEARLAGDLGAEDFITAVVAEVFPGRVRLANCGHHPPLHVPGNGEPALLEPARSATPLGLGADANVHEVKLAPGDRLLFYTDGLAEARNAHGVMPDLARVAGLCATPRLEDAVETVLSALTDHTGGETHDDIALVLIDPEPRVPHQETVTRHPARRHTTKAAGAN